MHLGTKRRQDAYSPVADLVTEAFDHDGVVVGYNARRLPLVPDVVDDVVCSQDIEPVTRRQPIDGCFGAEIAHLANERAERLAQLHWTSRTVPMPERHLARLPRSRSYDDPLEGDVLDPPRGRAEKEGFTGSRFVHHLFIQLTDPRPIGQEHAVEATIRDRARIGNREPLRARPATNRCTHSIPNDPRTKLAELLRGISARQQIEHPIEDIF